jgi:uncharacterized protein YdiU (UPF0061 family)
MSIKHNGIRKIQSNGAYSAFDQLDGDHPWMSTVKDGFVGYRVRELGTGTISYFNYELAKEMGLIAADHPELLSPELEKKLLQTFSLQIINEFDELTKRRFDPRTIKPNKYMATRYLQLQHSNKQGKTSGDGRGIWNGTIAHKGQVWDVSSRGTGVTCLSPGAVEAQKPLKTGGTEFGYGCGLAEMDELLGAAILSEIVHLQGINTERMLCIVDLGRGYGIGVRASLNLIRPAHLFLYLKQGRLPELTAATNYLIDRQIKNKAWDFKHKGKKRFDELLDHVSKSFAQFAAKLEVDYIFTWLDWDGDNVLADAGIIDYGSVRQFGIRHDKYRYDDVERYSTNLNEQKGKARLTVQVFAQMVHFLKTGEKKPLKAFRTHPAVKGFDNHFDDERNERTLYRIGFDKSQRRRILAKKKLFSRFYEEFAFFERAKILGKEESVADGINHAALFSMPTLLREFPKFLLNNNYVFAKRWMPHEKFFRTGLSSFAKARDSRVSENYRRHIESFQSLYKQLLVTAAGDQNVDTILPDICEHANKINSTHKITGNALIEIVDEIVSEKKAGLPRAEVQNIIDRLIMDNYGMPEIKLSPLYKTKAKIHPVRMDLYSKILCLIEEHKESI